MSLGMSPFDRARTTSYGRSIVTIIIIIIIIIIYSFIKMQLKMTVYNWRTGNALSRVVSEIFIVEKSRDLEIRVRGHSRSSKAVPFVDRFLLVFYSNFVRKMHRF